MRLTDREFAAMNKPLRQFLQRRWEFPQFQRMGLTDQGQDILEIGCGSGYGAVLLATLRPKSYVGIDIMTEQLALAEKRRLANAAFMLQDAADMKHFPDASKDVVVIFGVLHHIPSWRAVVKECRRVLRPGGKLYLEEPDGSLLRGFDRLFHWGHPTTFQLNELEAHIQAVGFTICQRSYWFGFGMYCARKS